MSKLSKAYKEEQKSSAPFFLKMFLYKTHYWLFFLMLIR